MTVLVHIQEPVKKPQEIADLARIFYRAWVTVHWQRLIGQFGWQYDV